MTGQAMHETTSADGTTIGYWTSGQGPPLVLVHGVLSDHSRWDVLRPHLEPHVTVHAMDRRGRGASGDAAAYDAAHEFEDIAAVVDAVAATSGSPVDVYGHSSGAAFTLSAALLTSNIRRLALYEPAISGAKLFPSGLPERLDALLADGARETVVETFCREALLMSGEQIEAYRSQPSWPARIEAAHTLAREMRVSPDDLFDPASAAGIATPCLLLQGDQTTDGFKADSERVAATLPGARTAILEGQGHTADVLAPGLVAAHLLPFLSEGR